jgi:hypothetical protein
MRNMSFAYTTRQCRARTKTMTRRLGWRSLKPGDLVQQVEKAQGLALGEHPVPIHVIQITHTRWEPLKAITWHDVILEGFPYDCVMDTERFIKMFCILNAPGCHRNTLVNRIVFRYID